MKCAQTWLKEVQFSPMISFSNLRFTSQWFQEQVLFQGLELEQNKIEVNTAVMRITALQVEKKGADADLLPQGRCYAAAPTQVSQVNSPSYADKESSEHFINLPKVPEPVSGRAK